MAGVVKPAQVRDLYEDYRHRYFDHMPACPLKFAGRTLRVIASFNPSRGILIRDNSEAFKTLVDVKMVLLHEMTHQWHHFATGEAGGHGKVFKLKLQGILTKEFPERIIPKVGSYHRRPPLNPQMLLFRP